MLKLIKLEWKKNNIGKSIWIAMIMTAVLCLFIVGTSGELLSIAAASLYDNNGNPVGTDVASVAGMEFYGRNIFDATVGIFTNMSFIIFTGVMLAGYIVGAYEKGTMRLMFSYPIKRRKIILSKILAVWIFNVAALIISKVFISVVLLTANPIARITTEEIQIDSPRFWLYLLLNSVVMVSIAFIALPVGLQFRSSKAAIVAAVIVVCFSQGNIGSYTLADSAPFYLMLLILAAAAVFLSIYNVERKDVG